MRRARCNFGCFCFVLLQIGQMASTRADFLPPQYYERVKTLQSDIPAESTAYIKYERSVYYVLPCF